MAGPRPMAESPAAGADAAPRAPAATDWLRQTLTVTGPTEGVAWFRAAAAGPGIIPWRRVGQLTGEFWSADWSPWRALGALRRCWPGLSFALRPDYAKPADG